jgi:hypothetical protein
MDARPNGGARAEFAAFDNFGARNTGNTDRLCGCDVSRVAVAALALDVPAPTIPARVHHDARA